VARIRMLSYLFTVIGVAGLLVPKNQAQAQNYITSDAIVNDHQTSGTTIAPVNESFSNSWSSGTAFAQTDYGVNHAAASITYSASPPVGPPSPSPFVYSTGISAYSDTFQFALNNNLVAPSTVATSAQFIVQLDGTLTLPAGFMSASTLTITSSNAGDAIALASSTDVGSILTETSTQDEWAINNSVSGATYTTQSFAIGAGGVDQVSLALYASVENDLSNLQFGTATADFANTGILKGVVVYDQNGDVIPNSAITITSTSGTDYLSTATPEPSTTAYCSAVAALFLLKGVRSRRRV